MAGMYVPGDSLSDTVKPHIRPFPGMTDHHPRAGFRQRQAIGVPGVLFLPGQGFAASLSLSSR
jgi:hypothetical protein